MYSCKMFMMAVFICTFVPKVMTMCPYKCDCRDEPTSCPFGTSLVKDGCNCCKMCARQQWQTCDMRSVCDTDKGLICDYSLGNTNQGLCKVQHGRSCSYNGRTYMNGEMFQPTCKHQCWCVDGTVGCLSLCPHETRVPLSKECPNARLVVSEGECCEKWLCGAGENQRELPLDKFWDTYVDEKRDSDITAAALPGNDHSVPSSPSDNSIYSDESEETSPWDISDLNRHSYYRNMFPGPLLSDSKHNTIGDGGSDGDELIDYQMAQVLMEKGGDNLGDWFPDHVMDDDDMYDYENWGMSNELVGDDEARRRKPSTSCAVQTTSWSPCSKSCGMGITMRVTNNNPECQLTRESRLCNLRPCNNTLYTTPKRGKHCTRHRREHKRTFFPYAGCKSVRAYRPRYCGGCDDGRCCTPQSTRSVKIRFRCDNGETFVKNMLMIRSCKCHSTCSSSPPTNLFPSRDLTHDMIKSSEA